MCFNLPGFACSRCHSAHLCSGKDTLRIASPAVACAGCGAELGQMGTGGTLCRAQVCCEAVVFGLICSFTTLGVLPYVPSLHSFIFHSESQEGNKIRIIA